MSDFIALPPESYPKRILLMVCGMSPQVVTETLFALCQRDTPFIPTEIHLLTTQLAADRIRLDLLHPEKGHFHRLCRDYQLPMIRFDTSSVHVLQDEINAESLSDIRTEQDNQACANQICDWVKQFTADENSALHVSIAGGRKTMGYYMGYALSLFGRLQDRLSHVLVSTDFESHPQFFYPTPHSDVLHTHDNKPIDPSTARVELADIPFVRLRDNFGENVFYNKLTFAQLIEQQQLAEIPLAVSFTRSTEKPRLEISGHHIALPPAEFCFYLWIVQQTVLNRSQVCRPHKSEGNVYYAQQYMALYQHWQCVTDPEDNRTLNAMRLNGMEESFFNDRCTRINKALKTTLGLKASRQVQIKKRGSYSNSDYIVDLDIEQVSIEE